MSTRGFVGFRQNGVLKGWYNHFDSYYEGLGLKVLDKYRRHNNEELKRFFNSLTFSPFGDYYENHKIIFNLDWDEETGLILQDSTNFLNDGLFCEYGYVFNLDNDTIEVYRGLFTEPLEEGQKGYKASDGTIYYCNKVLEVNRDNLKDVYKLFENAAEIWEQFEDVDYWEQEYMKRVQKIKEEKMIKAFLLPYRIFKRKYLVNVDPRLR